MTSILVSNQLGLSNTSISTLNLQNGDPAAGRSGEGVYVNAATGNLVVQRQDEVLMGRGLDVGVLRTYNSQAQFDGDNNDNWRIGFYRQIKSLIGTVNTSGSTVVRVDVDGAELTYSYDVASSQYINKDGAGSYDTIRYSSTTGLWTWVDGSSGHTEIYRWNAALGYRQLLSQRDTASNVVTYAYNTSGLLTRVTTANSSATQFNYTDLIYDTATGKTSNLLRLQTSSWDVSSNTNKTLTRVRYGYDASNRLTQVTVDLSPDDNSIADGKNYVTNYTYDGTSKRIATLTQTDGTSLSFVYDASGRITRITDALGNQTNYSYNTTNRITTVTDALGQATKYSYDASGQLTQIASPVVNGASITQSFAYNANGDITSVTDGEGNVTVYQYDANGNRTLERDALGNTITRTYNSSNQLLSQTHFVVADPDGAGTQQPGTPLTSNYVYDAAGKNQLRFIISAEGRVSEYRYNSFGQKTAEIIYTNNSYTATTYTESSLSTWVSNTSTNKAQTQRTDYVYDFRGQVSSSTTYVQNDSSGNGVTSTSSTTQYIYDPAGNLLQTIAPIGSDVTQKAAQTTTYTYDGLGRLLTQTDGLNQTTQYQYVDAHTNSLTTSTQVLANGLRIISSYDRAGRLFSVMRSNASGSSLGLTRYYYDKTDQLRMILHPDSAREWLLYDSVGRKVGIVNGNRGLTEYVYDKNGQIVQTITYANLANTTGLITDASNVPTSSALALTIDHIRPTSSSANQKAWNIYDATGRLIKTVEAIKEYVGRVTEMQYDGDDRIIKVIQYGNTIATSSLGATSTAAQVSPTASNNDRITRNIYDEEGLLRGSVDGEGYLTETLYDAAGQAWQTVQHATQLSSATLNNITSATSIESVRPLGNINDIKTYTLFDDQGNIIAEINAQNILTEYSYDKNGNHTQTKKYANPLAGTVFTNLSSNTDLSTIRPTANTSDQTTSTSFDALNRIDTQTNNEGTITQYIYDNVGNLTSTTVALNTLEARTTTNNYDLQGRITSTIDAKSNRVEYIYDSADRLIRSIDTLGNITRYYYDRLDQLVYTINALGEVIANTYNALNQKTAVTEYGTRIDSATLASLMGGTTSNNSALTNAITAITNAAFDSKTIYSYNVDGSLASSSDALGNLTVYQYNTFGEQTFIILPISTNNTVTKAYTYDRRGLQLSSIIDSAGLNIRASQKFDAFGRVIETIDGNYNGIIYQYDKLGRQIKLTDDLGNNTLTAYDAFDRVITQTDGRGNTTTTAYDTPNRKITITNADGSRISTVYNRHGQTQSVLDANGNTTTYSYDAFGNLTQTSLPLSRSTTQNFDANNRLIQSVDANGIKTVYTYDAANRVLTKTIDPNTTTPVYTGLNLVTQYAYDAKGQQISVTNPNGSITQYDYDLNGQLIKQTVDAGTSKLNIVTQYSFDAQGNQLTVTDALGNITRNVYDKANRLTYTVDSMGAVTRYEYDRSGNVVQKTAYTNTIASIAQASSVVPNESKDQITRNVYDVSNRLTYTVDSMGAVTRYEYDANGNVIKKTAYANTIAVSAPPSAVIADASRDQITRNVYDAVNRLQYSVDGVGAVTKYEYDANGNVIKKIAYANTIASTAQASSVVSNTFDRIIQYQYDAANRQIKTIYPVVNVYSVYTESYTQPTLFTQAHYDAMGNIITNRDAAGYTRHQVYDAIGQIRYAIDAEGYVTGYVRDAMGNVISLTRYADKIADSTRSAWISNSPSPNTVATLLTNNPANRTITTQYDALGRAIEITEPQINIWVYTSASPNGTWMLASPTTKHTYNALGQIIQTQVKKDHNTWLSTYRYYDQRGLETATIDALGYLTTQSYDTFGNVTTRTEYANAASNISTSAYTLSSSSNKDRTTRFAYDQNNRKLSETRVGVQHSTVLTVRQVDSTWSYQSDTRDLTTTYQYDSFGNLVRTADANGDATNTYYDRANRISAVIAPSQNIAGIGWRGLLTEFTRNTFGQVIHQTERAGGAYNINLNGYSTDANSNDRTQSVWYDQWGRMFQSRNALDHDQYYAYDANGNLAVQSQIVGGQNTFTQWVYDKEGRITLRIEPSSANGALVKTQMKYNAFGELTDKGIVGIDNGWSESNQYDKAGNIIRSNHGDGVLKKYTYDLRGNLEWVEKPLTRDTQNYYDALGRMTQQVLENGATIYRTYDRWGNLLSVSDARDASRKTEYTYSTNNQVLTETKPSDWGYTNAGTYDWFQATTSYYYDYVGRQVVVKDARGHHNVKNYDAAGNLLGEYDQVGNAIIREYNAFGNAVKQTDAMGNVTTYEYDKRGLLTKINRPGASMDNAPFVNNSNAVTLYTENDYKGSAKTFGVGAYANLGNEFNDKVRSIRVQAGYKITLYEHTNFKGYYSSNDHWAGDYVINENRPNLDFGGQRDQWWNITSSIVIERDDSVWSNYTWTNSSTTISYDELGRKTSQTNGAGETTQYEYDRRGNVTRMTQPGNIVTTNEYDAFNRKTKETDTNGELQIWSYNYFGRLEDRVDLGWANYDYIYDDAGRLIRETNSRGRDVSTTYNDAGQIIQITDRASVNGTSSWRTSTYEYDLAGNRTHEKTSIDGLVHQDHIIEYGHSGQLYKITDYRINRTLSYWYDTVGNRCLEESLDRDSNITVKKYYAFDDMNRQIMVDGAYSNVVSVDNLTTNQGRLISYDKNGNRTRETSNNGTETYTYDALNRLTQINKGGVSYSRAYDTADRLVWAEDLDTSDNKKTWLMNNYDAAGRLVYQYFRKDGKSAGYIQNRYDSMGNLTWSTRGGAGIYGVSGFLVQDSYYTYHAYDTYQQHRIDASRSDGGISGVTLLHYDVNGYLSQIDDLVNAYDKKFYNEVNGRILTKNQSDSESFTLKNLIVNGQLIASKGMGVDVENPTKTDGSLNIKSYNDTTSRYQVIDMAHPGTAPGAYRVNLGDTLQSIALGAYGDAGLWYLIADANGLQGNASLQVGTMLILPNTVGTVRNNVNTFKPYNALSIVGDTSPYTVPPSGSSNNCAQIGIMIAAIVTAIVITVAAVLVTVATLGAAGVPAFSGAGIAIGALFGAVGGAAASAASQGIMIAGGLQKEFSWGDVAMGAVTGLAGGSLGGYASGAGAAAKAGQTLSLGQKIMTASLSGAKSAQGAGLLFAKVATYAAVNASANAVGQGVKIAIEGGAFSWKSVAAAVVQGGFGSVGGLGKQGSWLNRSSDFAFNSVGDVGANLIINEGRFDPTQFVVDLAGNSFNTGFNALSTRSGHKVSESAKYSGRKIVVTDISPETIQSLKAYKAKHSDAQIISAMDHRNASKIAQGDKLVIIGHNKGDATKTQLGKFFANIEQAPRKVAIIACGAANDAEGANLARTTFDTLKARGMSAEVTGHTGRIQLGAGAQRILDNINSQKFIYGANDSINAIASKHVSSMNNGWLTGSTKRKAAEYADQAIKRQIIEGDLNDPTNKRSEYMGTTPSKNSLTGQTVIERMMREGNIRQTAQGSYELLDPKQSTASNKVWVNVDEKIHMGHKIDAVTFWNKIGRYHGEKSNYVRKFMTDPNNYELQIGSYNSSAGASLRQQYQDVSSTRRNSIYGDDRLQHYKLVRESVYQTPPDDGN